MHPSSFPKQWQLSFFVAMDPSVLFTPIRSNIFIQITQSGIIKNTDSHKRIQGGSQKQTKKQWYHSVCTSHTHKNIFLVMKSWNRSFVSEIWALKHCIQTHRHTRCHSSSCHFLSSVFVLGWFLLTTSTTHGSYCMIQVTSTEAK